MSAIVAIAKLNSPICNIYTENYSVRSQDHVYSRLTPFCVKHKNGASFPVFQWGNGHYDWRIKCVRQEPEWWKWRWFAPPDWVVSVSTGQQCFCPRRHNRFTLLRPCGRGLRAGAHLATDSWSQSAWLCVVVLRWRATAGETLQITAQNLPFLCHAASLKKSGRQRNFDSFSVKLYCLHSGPDIFFTQR